MRIAFKEWAIVVDALECGVQNVILRKGGIAEGNGGFQVEHPAFFLFPTLFHQQRESVVASAQARFDVLQPTFRPPDRVRISAWVEVASVHRVGDLDRALGLHGLHIWRNETIASRFDWGREQGIWALILRVMKLPVAVELTVLAEYGGCKSWIDLDREIDTRGSVPALADDAWAEQVRMIEGRLR